MNAGDNEAFIAKLTPGSPWRPGGCPLHRAITTSNASHATFLPLNQALSFVLAPAAAAPQTIGIPTLSEWSLIMLALLLGGFAVLRQRRG